MVQRFGNFSLSLHHTHKVMKFRISYIVILFLFIGILALAKTPVRYLAQDIITKQLGVSQGQVFTERDLSYSQLKELNRQVRHGSSNRPADVSIIKRNFDSTYQVQNILGKYRVTYHNGYCVVSDVYDFNRCSKGSHNIVMRTLETLAKKYGHSDKDTYDSKMKFKIKLEY